MKVEIIMPKMGESINEGTIIKWHKKIGDKVKKDEIIYEISTDKVDTEIPSPADGILSEIKAYENETVPINEVVAIIETNGDATVKQVVKKEEIPSTDQSGSVIDIPMPKMGESVMDGTIIKWHKKVGDTIKVDEILYEISTDKVDTEVPSPIEGVIKELLFKENDVVEVGKIVARISSKSGITKVDVAEKINLEIPVAKPEIIEPTKSDKQLIKSNRFYSPVVMNIAAKEGVSQVELDSIKGTGISGRVTKTDILNYLSKKGTQPDCCCTRIGRDIKLYQRF